MLKSAWQLLVVLLWYTTEVHAELAASDSSHGTVGVESRSLLMGRAFGQDADQCTLFQRKVAVESIAQGSTAELGQKMNKTISNATIRDSMSKPMVPERNKTKADHHLGLLERLVQRLRVAQDPDSIMKSMSQGTGELLSHPDVTMGLLVMLFILVPCFCCCGYAYCFMGNYSLLGGLLQLFNPGYTLHDKKHKSKGGMQPGKWMVLLEEGIAHVKFFSFDDQLSAQKFFNHAANFVARVLYEPLPNGHHSEVRAAGINKIARDHIRTWSHANTHTLVDGCYNVAIWQRKANGSLFYAFEDRQQAVRFLQSFEWLTALLYDQAGEEISTNGGGLGCCHRTWIRKSVLTKQHMVAEVDSSNSYLHEVRRSSSQPQLTRGTSSYLSEAGERSFLGSGVFGRGAM